MSCHIRNKHTEKSPNFIEESLNGIPKLCFFFFDTFCIKFEGRIYNLSAPVDETKI